MATATGPLPRAHHFVPQCWLSGFTATGDRDGTLWVTDLKRKKQWKSSPVNTGHRRDFYRVSDGNADPAIIEKAYGQIETIAAPVLKRVNEQRRGANVDQLGTLVYFAAFQYGRVPAFRPNVLTTAESIHRSLLARALESPESWASTLKETGVDASDPAASFEKMREFERAGFTLSVEREWYLVKGFEAAEVFARSMVERHWASFVSTSGSFIGSDNPVMLDGPKGQKVGCKSADFILFPVGRHVMLVSTKVPITSGNITRRQIAHHNTFTMLTAYEQIYSHAPDFCWEDETGRYQTDWRLFSRDRFEQSRSGVFPER